MISRVVPRVTKPAAQALDQRGTRRAPRFKMKETALATVGGANAVLIDLSTIGAQLVSPAKLGPNQQVAVVLKDDEGEVSFTANVAWTSFEIQPSSGPRYRAGIERLRRATEAAGRPREAVALTYRVKRYGDAVPPR